MKNLLIKEELKTMTFYKKQSQSYLKISLEVIKM